MGKQRKQKIITNKTNKYTNNKINKHITRRTVIQTDNKVKNKRKYNGHKTNNNNQWNN